MQKTALTIFGALLISGSMIQVAAASEHRHHYVKKHHAVNFRGAYDVVRPINASVSSRGFSGESFRLPDHFWIGGQDPALNPSD